MGIVTLSKAFGDQPEPDLAASRKHLEETKQLAEKLGDTLALARYYIYFSNILYLSGEYESAIENNYFCESLLKNTKYEYEKAINLCGKGNNLMELYIKNEQKEVLQSAQDAYKKAIKIFQDIKNESNEAHARNSLASSYLYSGDLIKAANEVKQSIEIGGNLQDTSVLLNGYYTLTTFYEMNANADSAIESLTKLKFFLNKTGNSSEFAFMKEQFGNSDAKISIALINSKIDIFKKLVENQEIEKEKQSMLLAMISLIGGVIVMVLFLAYFRAKSKLLKEKLNTTLKTQEVEFMRARFEGEEIGRQRIARQIHDGVGGLLVSAKWNLESALEEISKKETKVAARLNENLRLQENSYKELRRVVYELEREDVPWWEDLQKFYQELDNPNKTKIRFYTYNLDKRIGGSIGEEARLMVQEIVTNALKHAKASEITVQINQINDELGIIIEDNGIGFDAERVNKGIGLQSLDERCAKLGGSISFETGKGAGTTEFVDIPLKKQSILTENPLLYGTN